MGTKRFYSIFYRLLLPLLLALLLGSLVQAQEINPILSCRLEPGQVGTSSATQLTLWLRNTQVGLDLAQVALTVNYANPTLIVTPTVASWQTGDLVALDFTPTTISPGQIQFRANRIDNNPIAQAEGALARIPLQTLQQSGVVTFTLSAGSLQRMDGTEILFLAEPTCYLAIGDAQLPTQTATPTPTSTTTATVSSPVSTPTLTASVVPTTTPTLSPSATFTVTPTVTPTATPSETATVPVIVATPTPRLEDQQSPLATPTPITVTPATPGQTPDIALTLTVEAQAMALDIEDTFLETPIPTSPADLLPAPTATPPPVEFLSPPRLEDAVVSTAEEDLTAIDEMAAGVQSTSVENVPSAALNALPVETIQQPPAGIVFERSPILFRVGWATFIGAVALIFTSWWLRRPR